MTRLLKYFFPQKPVLTPEELNAQALRNDYREALHAYHAAIDRYNMAVTNENEDVLYKAIVIARDNVDNLIRLIKLNSRT